jgi:hypothetical protein
MSINFNNFNGLNWGKRSGLNKKLLSDSSYLHTYWQKIQFLIWFLKENVTAITKCNVWF